MNLHPASRHKKRKSPSNVLLTILLVVIAVSCRPLADDSPETITPAPTGVPTQALSPNLLPTQPLPTLSLSPESKSSAPDAPDESFQFDSLHAVTATEAWGTTTITDNSKENWYTILLRSTDGGANWRNVSPWGTVRQPEDIKEVYFLRDNYAWVATSADSADGKMRSITNVWHTQDGGEIWNKGNPISHSLSFGWDMVFADDRHGWLMVAGDIAAGSQSVTLFQTLNGGVDWEEINSTKLDDAPTASGQLSSACYKNRLWFRDNSTGWVMGDCVGSGYLLQGTQDGGHFWEFQVLPPPAEDPQVLNGAQCAPLPPVFSSPQEGILPVVCMFDTLLLFHSDDGGQTWNQPSYRRERQIGMVDFVDADNGWLFYFDAQGEKHLSVTNDGGKTWNELNPNLEFTNLSQLDFVDSLMGWAFLYNEATEIPSLCKTLDGGITWDCLTHHLQPGARTP